MSGFGGWMQGLAPLIENVSNRIGSGASVRHTLQDEEVVQRGRLNAEDIRSRVEAAKAAGLHPLAALGVNVAGSGMMVSDTPTRGVGDSMSRAFSSRLMSAQVKEAEANARRANADADIAEAQVRRSKGVLSTQPGQPPLVDLQPDQQIRPVPGQPSRTAGTHPSESTFAVKDAYGNDIKVQMPSDKMGQVMENSGELWQMIYGTPYALDYIYKKYLQSFPEFVRGNFGNDWRYILAPKLNAPKERR